MSQQDSNRTAEAKYQRRLFIDAGMGYFEAANAKGRDEEGNLIARIVEDYSPPTPTLRTAEIKILDSSSRIHASGKASYKMRLRLIFPSKLSYNDFMFNVGKPIKYYDENGGIFVGAIENPEVVRVEAGRRYDVKLDLLMIRKENNEQIEQCQFTDIKGHWAESNIATMTQAGLVASMDGNGNYVYTFRPDDKCTRAEAATFINRLFRYFERTIRG